MTRLCLFSCQTYHEDLLNIIFFLLSIFLDNKSKPRYLPLLRDQGSEPQLKSGGSGTLVKLSQINFQLQNNLT